MLKVLKVIAKVLLIPLELVLGFIIALLLYIMIPIDFFYDFAFTNALMKEKD